MFMYMSVYTKKYVLLFRPIKFPRQEVVRHMANPNGFYLEFLLNITLRGICECYINYFT